jgi:hypothetical protein
MKNDRRAFMINFKMFIQEISDENNLICFDKKHIRLIIFLLCFFLTAVLFKLHGYSISMWRNYLDSSAKKDILVGSDRPVRSDDWAVELPLMIAQLSHDPKYPLVNGNIATGLNMIPHSKVPIKHILTFFRPSVWGFFLGADYGLSWMWQMMVFGMFYVFFLVFMIISRNDFYISAAGSIFLLFAPFFQFWSFHMAEIPIFMGLIFISFSYLCFARKKITIMIHAFILGWALSCYTLNFVYPPYQVSCGYLMLFMMIAIVADRYYEYDMMFARSYRITALTISLIIFAYAGITYYVTAKDIIKTMMATIYPGQRFCVGGDQNLGILFRNIFFTLFHITNTDLKWGMLGNICESSSFLFFFPPIIAAILWQMISRRNIINKFSVIMIGYFIILLWYIFVGFPPVISKYSLFYMMHSFRSVIGLGVANVILMVSFLSGSHKMNRTERLIISCLWFVFLCAAGKQLGQNFDQISSPYVGAVSIIIGFFTYYLLNTEKKKTAVALLALISLISTVRFNPIVSGGTSFIYKNALSEKILEINKSENGNTKWAAFSDWVTPNLFRMIGVKAVNGTHSYPLFDVWEKFDPNRQYASQYNRYAHVTFEPSSENDIRFHSPSPDILTVYINPDSSILKDMGITHLLVSGQFHNFFDNNKKFDKLYTFQNKAIYKVNEQ